MKYLPETMTRTQLRKCYSRYAITMILYLAAIQGCAVGLIWAVQRFLPGYVADAFWNPVLQVLINEVSVYLPGLILIPLLMGALPRAEKLPVDRLMLGEMTEAVLFSCGALYLFAGLTDVLVRFLEQFTGRQTSNLVETFNSTVPWWLVVLMTVIVGPILEEVIFRKLLLDRLRGLGDLSAVVLSALAFGLFHANLYQLFYAFVVGMIFACVVLITGSVRDTILIHMFLNGFSILSGADLPEFALMLMDVFVLVSVVSFFVLFLMHGKKYQLEPGPLPFRKGEKRRACFRSVWFWLMLLGGLALSVITIFL